MMIEYTFDVLRDAKYANAFYAICASQLRAMRDDARRARACDVMRFNNIA